jgi:hypothetical protein
LYPRSLKRRKDGRVLGKLNWSRVYALQWSKRETGRKTLLIK